MIFRARSEMHYSNIAILGFEGLGQIRPTEILRAPPNSNKGTPSSSPDSSSNRGNPEMMHSYGKLHRQSQHYFYELRLFVFSQGVYISYF